MDQQTEKDKGQRSIISNLSLKTKLELGQNNPILEIFESANIIARYHQLQNQHFQQLAAINMSEILKKKLFGFSSDSYLTINQTPANLVIENHPITGRRIMNKKRYEQLQEEQYRLAKILGFRGQNEVSDQHTNSIKLSENSSKGQRSNQFLQPVENYNNDGQHIEKTQARLLTNVTL